MKITKVEAVKSEEKSAQEVEQELLEGANQEEAPAIPEVKISAVEQGDDQKEPEPIVEKPVEDEPVVHSQELKDEDVLSYIGKHTGREVKSWDDLVETKEIKVEIEKELDPEVSQYLKYKQETGRSMNDFMKLNRDFDAESDDAILAEYYSTKNPYLDAKEIEYKMNKEFKFDSELDDDGDIQDKKIAKKEKLAEAKSFFSEQKEKYKAPLGSSDGFISQEKREAFNQYEESVKQAEARKQQQEAAKSTFNEKTNKLFSDKFEGFKYSVGEKEFSVKVDDVEATKSVQSDAMNYINKHLDENGHIKDAAAYHKSLNAAMDPDALFKFAYEQGASDAIDGHIKDAKNIDMKPTKAGGKATVTKPKVEAVNSNSRSGRLTIRKRT